MLRGLPHIFPSMTSAGIRCQQVSRCSCAEVGGAFQSHLKVSEVKLAVEASNSPADVMKEGKISFSTKCMFVKVILNQNGLRLYLYSS